MSHAKNSKKFLKDNARVNWHNQTLWEVRKKRDVAVQQVDEWESLRDIASAIKDNVLSSLDEYLLEFEKNAIQNGVQVHWAANAQEHNRIVEKIIRDNDGTRIIKSKSLLTEECGLNHHLEKRGYEVVDSDLGERIIQFVKQPPSHIVAPAVHLKTSEISEIFHKHLGTEPGNEDPQYLTAAARDHLREKFIQADIAITGVNFGIAETGGFVVCTNEGNADLGVHSAKVHIACMGIEKILPKWEHLGVFTRILARSSTGQSITNYTSHFLKPRKGQAMHIVLVDNHRTEILGNQDLNSSLKCIRCGACMNTCPVYRRSGGHSYNATVGGPIGSILSPQHNMHKHKTLPFASTLCGACANVCPVKINLHDLLLASRQQITANHEDQLFKRWSVQLGIKFFSSPKLYNWIGKIGRWHLRWLPRFVVYNHWNTWGRHRDLPEIPVKSFKEWYSKNRQDEQ